MTDAPDDRRPRENGSSHSTTRKRSVKVCPEESPRVWAGRRNDWTRGVGVVCVVSEKVSAGNRWKWTSMRSSNRELRSS